MAYKQKGFSPFTIKKESAMKAGHKKSVPVPKKNESPAQVVARLQRNYKMKWTSSTLVRKKIHLEINNYGI